jgi:hypothetical protein
MEGEKRLQNMISTSVHSDIKRNDGEGEAIPATARMSSLKMTHDYLWH